ncbi:unnamed protein product, partial [Laminaria digitata]
CRRASTASTAHCNQPCTKQQNIFQILVSKRSEHVYHVYLAFIFPPASSAHFKTTHSHSAPRCAPCCQASTTSTAQRNQPCTTQQSAYVCIIRADQSATTQKQADIFAESQRDIVKHLYRLRCSPNEEIDICPA